MQFKIIHQTYLECSKMQIGTGSAHGTVLIFLLLLHFLPPISIPHPPHLFASLSLPFISHYCYYSSLLIFLALFLYISLWGTSCVPRMIYSGADILAESVCCGQDALFPIRCLKMVPTFIANANELLYAYIRHLHRHCGHNLIYLLFCLWP